jgi:hypothetical protein
MITTMTAPTTNMDKDRKVQVYCPFVLKLHIYDLRGWEMEGGWGGYHVKRFTVNFLQNN